MATNHLQQHCNQIPPHVRHALGVLRERRDTASGGKQYWADACRAVGLVEVQEAVEADGDGEGSLRSYLRFGTTDAGSPSSSEVCETSSSSPKKKKAKAATKSKG